MTTKPRRPGPESTLDQARELLISAAIELLRERGIDVGLGHIPLSDTIARSGVTRSTAYRSLADDELAPQAVLHREILLYLLTRYTRGDTINTLGIEIGTELDRHRDILEAGDVAGRTMVMRSIIRIGANASYRDVIKSPERSILTGIYGALQSSAQVDWRHHALAEGERGLTQMFSELYEGLAGLFQYQVKEPFTLDQFSSAGASLIEGIAMRHGFNDFVTDIERPTGFNGAMESWSLFAIAFESMFIGMFEPMNPDDPFADLVNF